MDTDDLKKTRSYLTLMRARHGADTPAGYRCSNLLEQLEILATATDPGQISRLRTDIKIQMDELSEITSTQSKG